MYSTRAFATAPLAALAVVLGAACGASGSSPTRHAAAGVGEAGPPTKLEVDAPFYLPGEEFHWEISFRGIVAGRAVMAVGEPGTADDRSIVILRSRVQSTGVAAVFKRVRDDVTSWVALDGGEPVFHRADVQLGKKEAAIETHFGDGPFRIDVSRLGRKPRSHIQELPEGHNAHDVQSLLGTLRAWKAQPGSQAYAYVLSGRRIWHLTATHTGREPIDTPMGSVEARRIEGVAWRLKRDLQVDRDRDPRIFRLWLTDDESKTPLRIEGVTEHGKLVLELTDHDRPETRVIASPPR